MSDLPIQSHQELQELERQRAAELAKNRARSRMAETIQSADDPADLPAAEVAAPKKKIATILTILTAIMVFQNDIAFDWGGGLLAIALFPYIELARKVKETVEWINTISRFLDAAKVAQATAGIFTGGISWGTAAITQALKFIVQKIGTKVAIKAIAKKVAAEMLEPLTMFAMLIPVSLKANDILTMLVLYLFIRSVTKNNIVSRWKYLVGLFAASGNETFIPLLGELIPSYLSVFFWVYLKEGRK